MVQNTAGELRLLRGSESIITIPESLRGEYEFTIHTHPEERLPGPASEYETSTAAATGDSMRLDVLHKVTPHIEAVIGSDGQVRFFDDSEVLPAGTHPEGGPIDRQGRVVPVRDLIAAKPSDGTAPSREMARHTRGPDGEPYRHDPGNLPGAGPYLDIHFAQLDAQAADPNRITPADNQVAPQQAKDVYKTPHEPLVPSKQDREAPAPPGLYRGPDGLLHRDVSRFPSLAPDPPGTWREFNADDRKDINHANRHHLHAEGDREGTWRQWIGGEKYALADDHGLIKNPETVRDSDIEKLQERDERHDIKNTDIGKELTKTSGDRIALGDDRKVIGIEARELMNLFGIESIHDLKQGELEGLLAAKAKEINDELGKSGLTDVQKQYLEHLSDRIPELREVATEYNALGKDLVDLSKAMAEMGGLDYGIDPSRFPGAVVLTPYEGMIDGKLNFDGSETFDIIIGVPASDATGGRTLIIFIECKGVGSETGAANTAEYGRVEQMTPQYKVRTAAIDQNLIRFLNERPEDMIARGIDPQSDIGKAQIKIREDIIASHLNGTLEDRYVLAHAAKNGDITISYFNQDVDGVRLPILDLAGIVRTPPTVQEIALELEQNRVREIELARERIREGLDPDSLRALDRAVEIYQASRATPGASLELQARIDAAMESIRNAQERGLTLNQLSREISAVNGDLGRLQKLELERGLELLRTSGIELNPSLAREMLGLEFHDGHRGTLAYLDAATRHLVQEAAAIAREYRAEYRTERQRFLGHMLGQVRELEDALAKGKTVDLAELQKDYGRVQQAIAFERTQEARALAKLGLQPEHVQKARDLLDNERSHTLGRAQDTFGREIVRQAESKVLEARERDGLEREQVRERALERVREVEAAREQGKELELGRVREEYDAVTNQIEKDRARDAEVVRSLGLAPEHAEAVTRSLEDKRAETFGKARESLGQEIVRQAESRVLEARERDVPERDERARFVERVRENARVMEGIVQEGETPNLNAVQTNYDAIAQRIALERERDARVLESLGLTREHAEMATRALDAERVKTYGRELEVFARELDRQQPYRANDPRVIAARAVDGRGRDARGIDARGQDPRTPEPPGAEQRTQQPMPNTTLERQRELAEGLARNGLSPELIAIRLSMEIGQAQSAAEAIRERAAAESADRTRAREREGPARGQARERGN
ncbi:hypothetical protein GFY24_36650 [Nocardia sp. SYP-A9097]|uniref:hypothetical protein n=1 Tax=Nocardia sp. SYP-A9097 TaxID=2663237 RepID=UPI00129BFE42|nr:hypothetical protein [Nocardia sp. SYP-A9097]MRH92888.1 hypothetical protein [Nocardia sp. SYP-A9097]